jgi:hypothetical protein
MKSDREIEILFRRLRIYGQLGRRAEGLVRTIQRVMRERYGPRSGLHDSGKTAGAGSVRRVRGAGRACGPFEVPLLGTTVCNAFMKLRALSF